MGERPRVLARVGIIFRVDPSPTQGGAKLSASDIRHDVSERIAAIIEPLRQEARSLDVEIAAVESRLAALRDDRKRIEQIISRADGTYKKPGVKAGTTRQKSSPVRMTRQPSAEHMAYVRRWLERDDIDPTHIVASHVHDAIRADAQQRGLGNREYPGADTVRSALHVMHEHGELRLRQTRGVGGHPIYAKLNSGVS